MDWIRLLLAFLYDVFFGCRHSRQTRPFTLERQTYKVCLDCGKQIYYSRERMTPLSATEVRRMKANEAAIMTVVPSTDRGVLVSSSASKSNAAA